MVYILLYLPVQIPKELRPIMVLLASIIKFKNINFHSSSILLFLRPIFDHFGYRVKTGSGSIPSDL